MWELISWEVDVMGVDLVRIDLAGVDLAGGPRNIQVANNINFSKHATSTKQILCLIHEQLMLGCTISLLQCIWVT